MVTMDLILNYKNDFSGIIATQWVTILLVTFLIMLSLWTVRRLFFPTILSHPWPILSSLSSSKDDKKKTVVFAGSFNPPHIAHMAMIAYLSERYGSVFVAIAINPHKEYTVSCHERARLIHKMLIGTGLANVEVMVAEGYVWRRVKQLGASAFVRGIRTWEKDGKEEFQLRLLNTVGPIVLGPLWYPIPTIYMESKPEYVHISSTLLREWSNTETGQKIKPKNDDGHCDKEHKESVSIEKRLKQFVPESIADDVKRLYFESYHSATPGQKNRIY